jgi:hypothetical protein
MFFKNEPLPSNDRGIHIKTHRLTGGFMECAIEMGSGAMIYIPSLIKISSAIQKLREVRFTDTHSMVIS